MDAMVQALAAKPLALLAGVLGMLCLTAWPLFRTRATMLAVQLGTGIGFTLQDALLGSATGAVMNALGGLMAALAIPIATRPRLRLACYGLLPVMALASVLTWQGPASILPTLGAALVTLGRLQVDVTRLRLLILAGGPFWAAHAYAVDSLPALAGNLATIAASAAMLARARYSG